MSNWYVICYRHLNKKKSIDVVLSIQVDVKPVDCLGQLLTVSHYQLSTGVSLQCYKCFGSADTCNSETAKKTTCLDGQDRCTSVITTKDGQTSVTLGCGDENDCASAENTCAAAETGNVRTTCEAKCCQSDTCNTPPEKGTVNLNSSLIPRSKE